MLYKFDIMSRKEINMKLRYMAVTLIALMMMCASACANSEKTDKPEKAEKAESTASSTAETQNTASTVSMPDPVPVPEGGWTDETIKDVIYINGKNLELPCTIDDFGDGFEIVPSKKADEELEEYGEALYELNYYGYLVGDVYIHGSNKIYDLFFDTFERPIEDYPEIPFSINGVTIGTPYSEAKKIMGEEILYRKDPDKYISFNSKLFWIQIENRNDKVSSIIVARHGS